MGMMLKLVILAISFFAVLATILIVIRVKLISKCHADVIYLQSHRYVKMGKELEELLDADPLVRPSILTRLIRRHKLDGI